MHLYRFFNPSAYGADKCVIIVAETNWKALHAYVDRYHHHSHMVQVSKDLHRNNAIVMSISIKQLQDGVIIFSPIFTLDID